MDVRWGNLTREEIKEALFRCPVVVLPIGSCEQHGPHLPVDTDTYDAERAAVEAAEQISPPPLVLPAVPYGVSEHHMSFGGTITLKPETLLNVVVDVAESAVRQGAKAVVVVNGHGGNSAVLTIAAQKIRHNLGVACLIEDCGSVVEDVRKKLFPQPYDVHAGEFETSVALATRPNAVRKDAIPTPCDVRRPFKAPPKVAVGFRMEDMTSTGVLGDATKADAERGKQFWQAEVKGLRELLESVIAEIRG